MTGTHLPWRIDRDDPRGPVEVYGTSIHGFSMTIATVWVDADTNAPLLAATPDLLHAARMLVDWWSEAYNVPDDPAVGIYAPRGCWICQPDSEQVDHVAGCPIPFAQLAIEKAVPNAT